MFKRIASQKLQDFIDNKNANKNVLLIKGARQVGKSTLIESVLKKQKQKVVSINLSESNLIVERIDSCKSFQEFANYLKDEFSFYGDRDYILYIDEAQLSNNLGSYVRFMKENWSSATVILSGSMMSELFKERFPVGRVTELTIRPLNFIEYLMAMDKESLAEKLESFKLVDEIPLITHTLLTEQLENYLKTGGLPAVIKAEIEEKNAFNVRDEILRNYRNDFTFYFQANSTLAFEAIKAVSRNVGSISKYSQVISPSLSAYHKVPAVLKRLEDWQIVLNVPQVGDQPEMNLSPKRYLFDCAVLQDLRYQARPEPAVLQRLDPNVDKAIGGFVENFVAQEMHAKMTEDICGYKSKNYEIDFILKQNQSEQVLPLEVKAALKNKLAYLDGMKLYCKKYGVNNGVCLTLDLPRKEVVLQGEMYFLPAYLAGEVWRLFLDR